ncbi:MAG: DASS family sodium-coupled anion symporter [Saprospiraceae bacterium]
MNQRNFALIAGPLVFLILMLLPCPAGMSPEAKAAAGITLWITIWWITEPVSVSVTALLPLILFPLTGVSKISDVSTEFGNQIIFLFLGGMFFGQAIERWNLHERIALGMVLKVGKNPAKLILGFMVATGFISMWISNTATAVMMTPVAIAVGKGAWSNPHDKLQQNFRRALMLGVAYACSIGGLATLIGTPTNAIFIGFVEQKMGKTVSFWDWFSVGFPFSVLLTIICWLLLIWLFPLPQKKISDEQLKVLKDGYAKLGPLAIPEKRLVFIFSLIILAWCTGSLFWYKLVPGVNDTIVALSGAFLLFVLPAGNQMKTPLLDWESAMKIPWGVLLFFGGGLALAKGFDQSGLAGWIGLQLEGLQNYPEIAILTCVLVVVVLLSELASNIATAAMMLPVMLKLAEAIDMNPLGLLWSVALAASIGFGLPVATAPNAIVFSSGYLKTKDMTRAGFLLDVAAILLLLLLVYTLLPWVWGFEL